ncbi:MAG TPA: hypothetical protein VEP90_04125 [Methylomirabilota bacterium]|nr:hypothetical protein [Methylomirabilota bacterium]
MLTIISTILGLLGSFGPGLLNYFTTKQNNDYQLQVIKLQMEAAAQGLQAQLEIENTKADIALQQQLYSYDNGPSGSPIIDGLKASVRPVITYTFFGLWLAIETITFLYAIHQGNDLMHTIPIIWDQTNQAIFATIIAFWFGSRVLEKYGIYPPINTPKTSVHKK